MRPNAAQLRRRRQIAGVAGVVGTALLGLSMSQRPGSGRFYAATVGTAAAWAAGGLAARPRPASAVRRGPSSRAPRSASESPARVPRRGASWPTLASPIAVGALACGGFYGIARAAHRIPILHRSIARALRFAAADSRTAVYATVAANAVAEEVFFRGAVFAALPERGRIAGTTAVYTAATMATRNPALVAAAGVMGTVFGLQRRRTNGIQAPVMTHVVWSMAMLPLLSRALRRRPAAPLLRCR